MPECFFVHLGDCEGRLVKAHLIPKQRIKREIGPKLKRALVPGVGMTDFLQEVIWDERAWAWMCGGPTGISGHHGAFDAKQLHLTRDELPEGVEEFAREYGLAWSLEADYGLRGDFYTA